MFIIHWSILHSSNGELRNRRKNFCLDWLPKLSPAFVCLNQEVDLTLLHYQPKLPKMQTVTSSMVPSLGLPTLQRLAFLSCLLPWIRQRATKASLHSLSRKIPQD